MRASSLLLLAVALAAVFSCGEAKKLGRCEIVRELRRHGIIGDLRNWVCLVEAESSGRTDIKGRRNRDGSYDYGLFQINSRYWCGIGRVAGECRMRCEDLLNNNLSDDVQCANKVYRRHGFLAWDGWKSKCRGRPLPDISRC